MADGSLARRYARAFVGLGIDSDKVDVLANDLHTFSALLDVGDGLLRDALNNPGLTVTERKGVLTAVLSKAKLDPLTNSFLQLVVDKSRFGAFDDICREYRRLADAEAGRVRATVTSAAPLTKTMTAHVEKALKNATGSEVVIDFQTDESLIGGIVAKVGDTVYDASVRSRLAQLQNTLIRESVAGEA